MGTYIHIKLFFCRTTYIAQKKNVHIIQQQYYTYSINDNNKKNCNLQNIFGFISRCVLLNN